jgi:hypothetical protein
MPKRRIMRTINFKWLRRIEELHSKGLIDENQKSTLAQMLQSPDAENGYLAKQIMGNKMAAKIAVGLNPEQTENFFAVIDFFEDPVEDAYVLKGYAGTGKTFLVTRILEYLAARYPNRNIAITAPTNKAVKVLQQNAPFDKSSDHTPVFNDLFKAQGKIKYMTIHKLLGLREQISPTGIQSFTPDASTKSDLNNFKYLIIDEVSMLSDELCNEILKNNHSVKLLFMGDPAQIPPVGKKDCIPFQEKSNFNFKKGELKQIMRQVGEHPVVDASFVLRNNLELDQPIPRLSTNLNNNDAGIIFIDSNKERAKVKPILKEYFSDKKFKDNANYMKVIAWRNTTVNTMNKIIRELIYGEDVSQFTKGEKLVVLKPIFEKSEYASLHRYGGWSIAFNTSDELTVIKKEIISKKMKGVQGDDYLLKFWKLNVRYYDHHEQCWMNNDIQVINKEHTAPWLALVDTYKKAAIKSKQKADWSKYYNVLKYSANVAYNYAITAHKAQGSTYTNVLLIEEDLDYNRKVVERNRIKYTAYSRPTQKLFILRTNPK